MAEQLRADGLRVWFDEWEIRPGDSIQAKVEDGLERSRDLLPDTVDWPAGQADLLSIRPRAVRAGVHSVIFT
ncbi:MAG: toll/interleukin-1 receptor domain-containing protein [Candidatus Binatia bacterium]